MTGTIVKTFGRYYTVAHDGGRINCVLRGRIKSDVRLKRFSEPVAVGDVVDFARSTDETGVIESIHERRNAFTRKDGGRSKEDLIAANLDLIVVIQSFARPRLNLRFVDRLIVRGEKEGIAVALCVNKADLAEAGAADGIARYYRGAAVPVYIACAATGEGIDELRAAVAGRAAIFVGNSGVGKSSILNRLYPGLDLRTNEISESTGKGRHTTTNAEMVMAPDGTRIIDTPGLREFGLMDIEPHRLGEYFMEFPRYAKSCSFRPCSHDHEPGCAVRRRVERGTISEERYISYLNILASLRENHENRYR